MGDSSPPSSSSMLSTMARIFVLVAMLFLNIPTVVVATDKEATALIDKLNVALNSTQAILDDLFKRWEVDKYPNFLQTAAMTKTSFDVLKLKFEHRMLEVATSIGTKKDFVISFMGSSVTAGHDSPFNKSFPILARDMMAPAFEPVGINIITRNAAMGNNPCMPYDICVRTFAGEDADIVHWEQSYNCMSGKEALLEEFVRQSIQMPSRPVVVFSDSATPNWKEDQCKDPKQKERIDDREKALLDAYLGGHYEELVCNLNKGEVRRWGDLQRGKDILSNYKIAGIQLFQHSSHEQYKCLGPYVKNWQCCSASWHPSLLGHELRAAHHSFTWLLIFKEALKSLILELPKHGVPALYEKASKHIAKEASFIPEVALYKSKVSNEMQCFTNYEPRANPLASNLTQLVVNQNGWKENVFENFISESILKKSRARGYKDVKYLLYGNKDAGQLSLQIDLKKTGYVFLCQTPGEWGKLPGPNPIAKKGFKNFWDAGTKVYLAENTNAHGGYQFDAKNVKELKYTHASKDTQDICVHFDEEIKMGKHILTIEPTSEENIIVSLILLP